MRVVVLGGTGAMGARAVALVCELGGVTEVVVAARDRAAAETVVASVSDRPGGSTLTRVSAVPVDVDDDTALRAVLEPADAVLNTVGPYRHARPILTAAIETETRYLDICGDWEATVQLLSQHEDAVRHGVTAVVGIGASPGLSSMLAAVAVRELDEVHRLYAAWPVDVPGAEVSAADIIGPDGTASAAVLHWLHQTAGDVPVLCNATVQDVPALTPVVLDYPGSGEGTAYVVGHPEPLTLPSSFGVRRDCATLMVVTPATMAFLAGLHDDLRAGRIDQAGAVRELAKPTIRRVTRSAMRVRRYQGPGALPAFFVWAHGIRAGQACTVGAQLRLPALTMVEIAVTPLVVALAEMIAGRVDRLGVHPPEAALDPDRVLAELARRWGRTDAVEDLVTVRTAVHGHVQPPGWRPNGGDGGGAP